MSGWCYWPAKVLSPREISPNPVPFSRSGGRTLGGLKPATRTDRGYWDITLTDVPLHDQKSRRTWNAIRTFLCGMAGRVVIPVWSDDTAPYASGEFETDVLTMHDDGTIFDDGTLYQQGSISVVAAEAAAIGATTIKLRLLHGAPDLAGVRFSYRHALYETGPAISVAAKVWTVPIFPAIVAAIPENATLEFNRPTCLVNLAEDRGMDAKRSREGIDLMSVRFQQDMAYWNSLV